MMHYNPSEKPQSPLPDGNCSGFQPLLSHAEIRPDDIQSGIVSHFSTVQSADLPRRNDSPVRARL